MIITIIFTIFLGLIALVDKALGAIIPLTKGTVAFASMLNYVDLGVYYVRSIFPVTISNFFAFFYILFNIAILLAILRLFKSFIPGFNKVGSRGTLSWRDRKHIEFMRAQKR